MSFHNGGHQLRGLERPRFQLAGPRRACAIDKRQNIHSGFQSWRCFWLLGSELMLPDMEMPHHWAMGSASMSVCLFVLVGEVGLDGWLRGNEELKDNSPLIPNIITNYLGGAN